MKPARPIVMLNGRAYRPRRLIISDSPHHDGLAVDMTTTSNLEIAAKVKEMVYEGRPGRRPIIRIQVDLDRPRYTSGLPDSRTVQKMRPILIVDGRIYRYWQVEFPDDTPYTTLMGDDRPIGVFPREQTMFGLDLLTHDTVSIRGTFGSKEFYTRRSGRVVIRLSRPVGQWKKQFSFLFDIAAPQL